MTIMLGTLKKWYGMSLQVESSLLPLHVLKGLLREEAQQLRREAATQMAKKMQASVVVVRSFHVEFLK